MRELTLLAVLLLTIYGHPVSDIDKVGYEEGEEFGEIKKCLSDDDKSEHCYTEYNAVATDMKEWALSFKSNRERPGDASANFQIGAPDISIPLTVVELAVKEDEGISNSPLGYLTTFGYVKGIIKATCNDGEVVNKDVLVDSLQVYQKIANIKLTGSLDSDVWSNMQANRCGMPDINLDDAGELDENSLQLIESVIGKDKVKEHRRRKRWVTAPHRLDKTELLYKLTNFATSLPNAVQTNDIDQAFQRWDDASPLTLTKAKGKQEADIKLSFESQEHGDGIPFEDGVMAHAFYPKTTHEGQVHFDNSENWKYDSTDSSTANLPWVATHEIGHALGLQHSLDPDAIMYYKHGDNVGSPDLRDDDIAGIQYLYGNVITNCLENWKGYESKCYKVENRNNKISWTAAQEQCQSLGGELASLSSSGINSFVSTISIGYTPFWIGKMSDSDEWSDGSVWSYEPSGSRLNVRGKAAQCLTATFEGGALIWDYQKCNYQYVSNFICQREQEQEKPGPLDTEEPPVPPTQAPTDELPVSCEDKVAAALRRGNYLYLFGATHYYKYLLKTESGPPKLQYGYPKQITKGLPGIPSEINSVFNDPLNVRKIYFVSGSEVYSWVLPKRNSKLEAGKLQKAKASKVKRKFGATETINAAVKFDRDSIFMFSYSKVGKWTKDKGYKEIKKWDYFTPSDADAISECKWAGWLYVFREKEYFLFRKSDGKVSKIFTRNIESDFEKFSLCDYAAPIVRGSEGPDDLEEGPAANLELESVADVPYPELGPNDVE